MEQYLIETIGLTKQYGEQIAVQNVSLHLRPGRIYGLLGRNGAGKTTIMKMLLGLTKPTSGEVRLFGTPLHGNERALLPRVGSLIEAPGFYPNLTATENLALFADLRGVPRREAIKHVLTLVGLPYQDKKLTRDYSMGMKQRLGLAMALLHDPELLILDEPINGLDPIGIAEMRAFLLDLCHHQRKTILLSSHILSEIAQLADDVGIIDHGNLLEEETLAELERRNRRYIQIGVSDAPQAARLLETAMRTQNFDVVDDHTLRLYDLDVRLDEINRVFMENHLSVTELRRCEDTLEAYFKRVTGGEGIA